MVVADADPADAQRFYWDALMNTVEQATELVDIGVNLAHRSFHIDRDQVVRRAFAAGVRMMVVTGTSVAASEEAIRIACEYPLCGNRTSQVPLNRALLL